MHRPLSLHRLLVRAAPLLLAACAGGGSPGMPYELVRCPAANPALAEAYVDAEGDVLRVRGHTFDVPDNAVRGRTRFRVRDRHTGYAGVDIEPHGTSFDVPAVLTLSYAGCDVPPGFTPMVVEVRPGTTTIVGTVETLRTDSVAQTVTVLLPHLSGYLVGGNREGEGD